MILNVLTVLTFVSWCKCTLKKDFTKFWFKMPKNVLIFKLYLLHTYLVCVKMDVGVSEMNRFKNSWTDFYAVFLQMVRVVFKLFKSSDSTTTSPPLHQPIFRYFWYESNHFFFLRLWLTLGMKKKTFADYNYLIFQWIVDQWKFDKSTLGREYAGDEVLKIHFEKWRMLRRATNRRFEIINRSSVFIFSGKLIYTAGQLVYNEIRR